MQELIFQLRRLRTPPLTHSEPLIKSTQDATRRKISCAALGMTVGDLAGACRWPITWLRHKIDQSLDFRFSALELVAENFGLWTMSSADCSRVCLRGAVSTLQASKPEPIRALSRYTLSSWTINANLSACKESKTSYGSFGHVTCVKLALGWKISCFDSNGYVEKSAK